MTTLFSLLILTLLITAAIAGNSAAPWVPARKHDIERFLNAGKVTTGDTVFDLGCGDGRLVGGATRRGANASGFEISLFPYILAKIRGIFLQKKLDNIQFTSKTFGR